MTGGVGGWPATARAWAELLRVSALFSVPGDALAGSATEVKGLLLGLAGLTGLPAAP